MHLADQWDQQLKQWKPNKGPQQDAFNSKADILFFGGAAGGGKTDLTLGLCHLGPHQRAIIFRRTYSELKSIITRGNSLYGDLARYNSVDKVWKFFDGSRSIELGAVQYLGDEQKFQGQPHDLICFDEIDKFAEAQFRFLIGWNRPMNPETWNPKYHRCRVVCTGNPPVTAEGDWVLKYWGPWLDPEHPNPAKPGELRYFISRNGQDIEMENGEPFMSDDGYLVRPLSRTFIPSRVEDNPFLLDAGYRDQLESLPEPLRSKMLYGSFEAGREDADWQIIPTAWVRAAQDRWKPQNSQPMTAIGIDVARGGKDKTIFTPVYGSWIGEQIAKSGKETPNAQTVVAWVQEIRRDNAIINIDVCGIGSAPYDLLKHHNFPVYAMNSSEASEEMDKAGIMGFYNKRAEWWWKMREMLDPVSGYNLALPPDRELLADLTCVRWEPTSRGIKVELKEKIKERIGRSPDKGDSLAYALATQKLKRPAQFVNYSYMR